MTAKVQCPVCHYDNISGDKENCPQCNADLVSFRLLERLPDSQSETSPEALEKTGSKDRVKSGKPDDRALSLQYDKRIGVLKSVIVILGITVVVLFAYLAYRFSVMGQLMQQQKAGLVRVIASLDNYSQKDVQVVEIPTPQDKLLKSDMEALIAIIKTNAGRLDRIESQISNIVLPKNIAEMISQAEKKPCFKIYTVEEWDTLWDISRTLYGLGSLYPVLLFHNPDIHINISTKEQLRYLCDPSEARILYKNIIGKSRNKLYWKYTVRPGDTRPALVKRYCPGKVSGKANCFVDDTPVEPGKTIGIYLE